MDWFLPKVRGNCSKWIIKGSYLTKQNEGLGAIMISRICPCRNSSMDFFFRMVLGAQVGEKNWNVKSNIVVKMIGKCSKHILPTGGVMVMNPNVQSNKKQQTKNISKLV